MPRATIVKEEISERNMRFLAIYVETKNAVLVLLSEGEDQLGTLAASVPSVTEMQLNPLLSSVLLGDRNTGVTRMLAERLSSKTGKIGLVSIHLRTISETEATPVLMRLFEKVTTVEKEGREQKGERIGT
ncbi:MAG: proteasome assembly chaperone 4 family protein [Candidatus Bathyarchaeia archaeon]